MKRFSFALATLPVLLCAPLAGAHHSYANFEREESVFSGTLVEVHWVNPHILLSISDGARVMQVEWMTLTGAEVTGVSSTQFTLGKRIVVTGSRHRDPELALMSLVKEVELTDDNWRWNPPVRGGSSQ